MDTRKTKGKEFNPETPDNRGLNRTLNIENLTKSFLKITKSPMRFATKEEMERREEDEICTKHGNYIVAFEEKTGDTLCEKWVYLGQVENPVFTASVAKQIKRVFDSEYSTFEKLCGELMSINQSEVRNRIQESVCLFFDYIRAKWDELEERTVAKIENSKNLGELVSILDTTHSYMEDNCVAEKYDSERTKLDVKISEVRYTYVCQRKKEYDEIIKGIESDNRRLSDAIDKAKRMINSIFDVDKDENKITKTLNELVSGLMNVDEKHPDFNEVVESERQINKKKKAVEEFEGEPELIKQEINFSASEHRDGNWDAEEMREQYVNLDNKLVKRELQGSKMVETEIMKLKLHLQKIVTVPSAKGSKVFLIGGAKDPEGKQAINNCYEVNLAKKTMAAIDKLPSSKLSFAAAISPDAKSIYIAGGSKGENMATNECEVFDLTKKKWNKLPNLNQPRFSASLIVWENTDAYCFGGVDNDPKDPVKFSTLKSIETLRLTEEGWEWEVLKISLPYKTSSPGAISLGHRAFVVFGGWNKLTLSDSAIIRAVKNSEDYAVEECGKMSKEDSFIFNGLVARSDRDKEIIVFGSSHAHSFNEGTKAFTLIE